MRSYLPTYHNFAKNGSIAKPYVPYDSYKFYVRNIKDTNFL